MNAEIFALLFKVSLVLAVAASLVLLLRGSSAARRHFVWSAAMTSVVVLVVLQLVVPPIVVPVAQQSLLAAFAHAPTDRLTPSGLEHSPVVARAPFANMQTSHDMMTEMAAQPTASGNSTTRPPAISNNAVSSSAADSRPENVHSAIDTTPALQITPEQIRSMLLSVWCIGTVLLLSRLAFGHWQLRRVARSSQVVLDVAFCRELDRTSARLGLGTPVQLLVHRNISTPCTAGWRKPVIMLPANLSDWNAARREAVLTHELAHIARSDSLAQTIASVACTMFWFHPAFWVASRMLRAESERAADDCVISLGMAPVDYADHLMAIVNSSASQRRVPVVALGMARSSQLELRLRAMLNTQQSRRVLTRGVQRVFGTTAMMVMVPFAALQARVQEPVVRPVVPVVVPAPVQPPVTPSQVPVAAPVIVPVPAQSRVAQPPTSRPRPVLPATVPSRGVTPVTPPVPVLAPPLTASDVILALPVPGRPSLVPPLPSVGDATLPSSRAVALPLNHGAAIPVLRRGFVARPLPRRGVDASQLPSRAVITPPRPIQDIATPVLPSRSVGTPPRPIQDIATPALPSRGVGTPPRPIQDIAVPILPSRSVVTPPRPTQGVVTVPSSAPSIAPPVVVPTRVKPPQLSAAADTTYERTIDAVAGESLFVNIPAGGNVTVHGWDANTAKLSASLGGKYWRETKVLFYRRRSNLELFAAPEINGFRVMEPPSSGSPNIILRSPLSSAYTPTTVDNEFELWVPRKMHVKFTSPIGALTIRDMNGDFSGGTRLGALEVSNSRGKSSLSTDNGDIYVTASQLSGFVHTKCGGLSIANTGDSFTATTDFDAPRKPLLIIDGVIVTQYCENKPQKSTPPAPVHESKRAVRAPEDDEVSRYQIGRAHEP